MRAQAARWSTALLALTVLLGGAAIAATTTVSAGQAQQAYTVVGAIVAGLALSACAVFIGQSCATGAAASLGGTARSSAVGMYLTAYYLGGSVGGVAPAPLFARSGWAACVALLGAVVAASVAVAVPAWRTSRAHQERAR